MRLEDAVLLAVGQAGVQRQHFGMAQIQLIQRIGGIANLPLAAHKDQNIPWPFAPQLVDGIKDRLQLIALGIVRLFHYRPVAHFHRVSPPGDFDNRRIIEML